MARVFISHASVDDVWADEVHAWLSGQGHDVFIDHGDCDGIAVGDAWEQRLYERLRWTDAVLCLVTPGYGGSSWCAAEIGFARARGCELLPVLHGSDSSHPLLVSTNAVRWGLDPQRAMAALEARLLALDAAGGRGWEDGRSPFPGLQPFEKHMHLAFFGRSTEVSDLVHSLRSPRDPGGGAPLLVTGPSGTGKSSLVRAGLAPAVAALPGWWVLPPMVTGAHPVSSLAVAVAEASADRGLDWTTGDVRERLERDDGLLLAAGDLLRAAPGRDARRRLLVIVDQFEELLTQSSPEDRQRFTALLRTASAGPVRVVGTLRTDSLDAVLNDPALSSWGRPQTYLLGPLSREMLRRVITGPAELAGFVIDDDLVSTMVEDTGTGHALPLLSFALARLADGVVRGGRLTATRYREIGGVRRALTDQADRALEAASHATGRDPGDIVEAMVQALVTVDDNGQAVGRRAESAALSAPVREEFQAFVEHRLVTTDSAIPAHPGGGDDPAERGVTFRVTHEALLTQWDRLREAIRGHAKGLRARREVELAAQRWQDTSAGTAAPSALLWDGGQLAGVCEALAVTPRRTSGRWLLPGGLPELTTTPELEARPRLFLAASLRRDRRRAVRVSASLATLLVIALIGTVGMFTQTRIVQEQARTARQQRQVAVARQLIAQAEAQSERDAATALRLDLAAHSLYPSSQTRGSLVDHLLIPYTNSSTLTGHTAEVVSVAFSPDGARLATASGDGTVILWDLSDPAAPTRIGQPLTGHTAAVLSVAFSPDGASLATASDDDTVILWDLSDPAAPTRIGQPLTGHTDAVVSVAFSPDGTRLATASGDDTVILWDLSDPAAPTRIGQPLTGHTAALVSVAFSPDGTSLATASSDGTVSLWDLSDPAAPTRIGQPLTGHTDAVVSVAFSPDGTRLATASVDGTVILWDLSDPAAPTRIGQPLTGHSDAVVSVAFSPDGTSLATASNDDTVILWDLSDPAAPTRIGQPLTGHTDDVVSVAFSPDGASLATASNDDTVILWDLSHPAAPTRIGQPLTGHTDDVRSVAFSPDGTSLATASNDDTVILWDLSHPAAPTRIGQPLTGHTDDVRSVAFSPDGASLATASNDDTVILWDLSHPAAPTRIGQPLTDHTDAVRSVAFSPDGASLATASDDDTVILWDLSDPAAPTRIGQPLSGHTDAVWSVAFSPDGASLATASRDDTVILWDLSGPAAPTRIGQPLTDHTDFVWSVAFSPDGARLATAGSDLTVILWDLSDPAAPTRIGQPLTGHTYFVVSVAFSPDGASLATASRDDTVILWDLSDPAAPTRIGQPLTDHADAVSSVAFSPDGARLATASSDDTVILWDLTSVPRATKDPVGRACARMGHGLDREEWARYVTGIDYRETCPQDR